MNSRPLLRRLTGGGTDMNNEVNPFRGYCYVKVKGEQERQAFIEYLEAHGFKCDEDEITTRQSTIDSVFPITVDAGNKMYGHLHNVTCSAAAVTSGKIITAAEFIEKLHYLMSR